MSDRDPRIYLLPNLMTAGNLFCGFAAILRIFEGMMVQKSGDQVTPESLMAYYHAIWFILAACIFDLLDGRVARLVGTESDFGKEFDSIADIVSFGVAPALLVFDIVLSEIPEGYGYLIAFIYLVCGAMRLARFNCAAAEPGAKPDSDFRGVPIPAAAGVVASITLFLLYNFEGRAIGLWKHILWILMLLVSYLMFSKLRYPSFKGLNWRTKRSIPWVLFAVLLIIFTIKNWFFMPAVIFVSYLCYGLVRPWVSRRWRREIEIESDSDSEMDHDEDGERDSVPAQSRAHAAPAAAESPSPNP